MLVDALVAAELYAYSEQMLHIPAFLRDLSTSPFARNHPLWQFVKGHALTLVFIVAIPIGGLVALVKIFDFQGIWPLWVSLEVIGIWGLLFLIGLVALPSFWASESQSKKKVINLLDAMNSVYTEIDGHIISAKHIRERLTNTTDKGAIWPSEVFPLLDDIIDRDGVM